MRWRIYLLPLFFCPAAWAHSEGWGGWGFPAPPMVAVTPPAIVLPQINISAVPLWSPPPPVVYYGPQYGYAPYGYPERHHGHGRHHHDRD